MNQPVEAKQKTIEIYIDGACSGNPVPGGWGAVLYYGEVTKEIYGSDPDTTNNKMEIMAAIEALKLIKKSCIINFYTDSVYLRDGITKWIHDWKKNNWRKRDNSAVKNAELWKILEEQIQIHHINWHWVRGHSGIVGNELADKLAVKGRDEAKKS
jgi:ribonuclease HI